MRAQVFSKCTFVIAVFIALSIAFSSALVSPAFAQDDAFSSGTLRFSGSLGASSGFGGSNVQVGLGVGYYILDGLELGLDARSWLGGEYNVHELEPSITYVFSNLGSLKPYGGLMHRTTFIEGYDNTSAYGGRAGIFLQQSRNLHVRAGVVGIWYQDCDDTVRDDCSEFYPEISVGVYF